MDAIQATTSKPVEVSQARAADLSPPQAAAPPASSPLDSDRVDLSPTRDSQEGAPTAKRRASIALPKPKPPPAVRRIQEAVEAAPKQKRPFLAVLSYPPPPEGGGEVDLRV
ncbi:MAG: hypothetical protein HYY21_11385 [Candidatus Tectomicrobia bacterium]|nr:hypothetical protein [Candidatus Tectomicrobia bacterium]